MIAMKIFYSNVPGARFDLDYYKNHHMARVQELAGDLCKGIKIEEAINDEAVPFRVIGTELYETIEDYHKALDPYREELRADIENFTDIIPAIQFFELVE